MWVRGISNKSYIGVVISNRAHSIAWEAHTGSFAIGYVTTAFLIQIRRVFYHFSIKVFFRAGVIFATYKALSCRGVAFALVSDQVVLIDDKAIIRNYADYDDERYENIRKNIFAKVFHNVVCSITEIQHCVKLGVCIPH
ncbi:hypothetical protein A2121_01475 [Candidatus Nomurabacteria bacterium GWB1_40_6]|uniref:Uncharacterized protein n=1 Tax=Candidatus Nomurabacteria bacterium GWB1_40_6 TaxID=1801727 RepID=A0A1F6TN39_9BACT|nr:MAG: hypothetical protein A2121_01475 [Candidatus Nomurabacteria bacterium GWB1_40_6]